LLDPHFPSSVNLFPPQALSQQERNKTGTVLSLQTAQKSDFQKQMTVRRGDGKWGRSGILEDKSILKEVHTEEKKKYQSRVAGQHYPSPADSPQHCSNPQNFCFV